MRSILLSGLFVLQFLIGSAIAGEADVINAKAREIDRGVWRISATVSHTDEGWSHYADKWEVVGPDGIVIGTRALAHPHENEQPFTRTLGAVRIDPALTSVQIRAHDSVHGYGGKEFTLSLPKK